MEMKIRKYLILLAAVFGTATLAAQERPQEQQQENLLQFQKLIEVCRDLLALYVDDVEMKPVVEGGIRGMLEKLDPHSAYLDAEEMRGGGNGERTSAEIPGTEPDMGDMNADGDFTAPPEDGEGEEQSASGGRDTGERLGVLPAEFFWGRGWFVPLAHILLVE